MGWFLPQDILSSVKVRPFERKDQVPAKQLILHGLAEHWGWLDPSKNPDLDDIASCYSGGVFLVAVYRDEIVGTGGLLPGIDGSAQIVRVHVAEHFRRIGVGSLIMDALSQRARASGYKRLILETTATWEDAIAFYQRLGFQTTHHLEGEVYMAKQLVLADPPNLKK